MICLIWFIDSVMDFMLEFFLCRQKNHLLLGHRIKVDWISPSSGMDILKEPYMCSISLVLVVLPFVGSMHKIARLSELSVRFTSA